MTPLHEAAQAACEQIGVIYQHKPTDGSFHTLDVEGKATRNGNGRIRFYADGAGGQVWNHVTADTLQFWAKSGKSITQEEAAERLRLTGCVAGRANSVGYGCDYLLHCDGVQDLRGRLIYKAG